jgi:hypothetical protein
MGVGRKLATRRMRGSSAHRAVVLTLVLAPVLLAACGGSDDAGSSDPPVSGSLPSQGNLLFIVRGPAEVSRDRLDVKTHAVEWFTDHPDRRAGASASEELVDSWDSFGFAEDPPNAALSGTKDFVTVELSDPQLGDEDISFAYRVLNGKLRTGDRDFLSLFVDVAQHKDNPTSGQHKDNPTSGQHKDNPTSGQHKDNPTSGQHKDNPT